MRTIYFGSEPDAVEHVLYLAANWGILMLGVLGNMIRERAIQTLTAHDV